MADGIDMAVFLSTLFAELTTGKVGEPALPIVCVTDCMSLFDAIKSNKLVTEKRLRIEMSGIKELVDSGTVKQIRWYDTKSQLADCLTKEGASLLLRKTVSEGVIHLK